MRIQRIVFLGCCCFAIQPLCGQSRSSALSNKLHREEARRRDQLSAVRTAPSFPQLSQQDRERLLTCDGNDLLKVVKRRPTGLAQYLVWQYDIWREGLSTHVPFPVCFMKDQRTTTREEDNLIRFNDDLLRSRSVRRLTLTGHNGYGDRADRDFRLPRSQWVKQKMNYAQDLARPDVGKVSDEPEFSRRVRYDLVP